LDEEGKKQALRAFLEGAGIETESLPDREVAELMASFGTIFREVVQGLMELLRGRTSLKSEFRIGVTGIQPANNNPLKFSANVDEVLEHLLLRPGRGYLPPVETIRDGLRDIKEHQWATIEGMRAALGALLRRFDPKMLEQKFDAGLGRAALLTGRRSKYWELYTAFHEAVLREAEDRFQVLFGDEFARAYEEQIRALAQARKPSDE
jgi:type VI secretion system FHA domain protein